jgi:hypothetical protein
MNCHHTKNYCRTKVQYASYYSRIKEANWDGNVAYRNDKPQFATGPQKWVVLGPTGLLMKAFSAVDMADFSKVSPYLGVQHTHPIIIAIHWKLTNWTYRIQSACPLLAQYHKKNTHYHRGGICNKLRCWLNQNLICARIKWIWTNPRITSINQPARTLEATTCTNFLGNWIHEWLSHPAGSADAEIVVPGPRGVEREGYLVDGSPSTADGSESWPKPG